MNLVSAFNKVRERFGKLKTPFMVAVQWAATRDAERVGRPTELYRDPDYMVDYLRQLQIDAAVKARHAALRSTDRSTESGLQRKPRWTSSTSH
jgi:hypothetical protein